MSALLLSNLGVICTKCDFLNVVGAARCVTCGAPTGDAPAATAPSSGRPDTKAAPLADNPPPSTGSMAQPPGLKIKPSAAQPAAAKPESKPLPKISDPTPPAKPAPAPEPAQPAAAAQPAASASGPKFALNVIAGPARGQKFRVSTNGAQVGRSKGVVLFPDDPFVSPLHASVVVKDGRVTIRDEGSTSGVYVSIQGQETIPPDCYFATGLRLFRYAGALEPAPPFVPGRMVVYGAPVPPNQVHYHVEEILLGDRPGRAVVTAGPILTIGQSKCDLAYPGDDGMAPRHCELSPMPTGAMIRDLSGGLGTYVRVKGERQLKVGDRVRVGQQTLQLEAL
ncbi:MAG: FHA domain-containing protein [Myxococcaceae bacterium]|nr:FHA domain-containing protein [Myxococcaceae bacterium]